MTKTAGTLFLVGTPIGNLEDMTFRAVRVLREADLLFCEDTRRTATLLRHFGIERVPESFHDHSSPKIVHRIRGALAEGKSVAYATDGGLPVVSDPGFVLVRAATEMGAPVSVIPGPSAAVMLFASSALASPKFLFHGFFPRTKGEVERTLEVVRELPVAHLFYEAPGRTLASLEILQRNLPDAQVVVGRELTKVHEEVVRGSAREVYEEFSAREKIRGECVIAVLVKQSRREVRERAQAGAGEAVETGSQGASAATAADSSCRLTAAQEAEIAALVKSGMSSKDVAKELSKKFKTTRRTIYEFIIRRLT